jgi:chromosome segregation ATPase
MIHIFTIAAFDGWDTFNVVLDGVVITLGGIILNRMNSADTDRTQLKNDLGKIAGELIDSKLETINNALDEIKQRLRDGERAFDGSRDSDRRIELSAKDSINQVAIWVRENAAAKVDLQRHQENVDRKFDNMFTQMSSMSSAINSLTQEIRRHA